MKKIMEIVKRVVLSFIVLYGYNLIAVNFNLVLPINIFTIGIITVLGLPSLLALIFFKLFVL